MSSPGCKRKIVVGEKGDCSTEATRPWWKGNVVTGPNLEARGCLQQWQEGQELGRGPSVAKGAEGMCNGGGAAGVDVQMGCNREMRRGMGLGVGFTKEKKKFPTADNLKGDAVA